MPKQFTPLSAGALQKIISENQPEYPLYFQILSTKRVGSALSNPTAPPRYKAQISDGVTSHNFGMLAIELNHMVESNELTSNSIVRITRCTCSVVNRQQEGNERRIILITEMTVEHPGEDVGEVIGNPQTFAAKTTQPPQALATFQQKENLNGQAGIASGGNRNQYQRRDDVNQSMDTSSANLSEHLTLPIESLSPYQNKWVIKARVMSKSSIRQWNNARGEGKLFSFDLCDETSEIRATAFTQQCDKFYDFIEVDKVYYITKCSVKAANKQFSKLKNDYEMTLTGETVIQECTDVGQIPTIKYNFVTINDVGNMEAGAFVDVIGLCKDVSDLVNLTSKQGRDLTKRDVTLVDQSNASIVLTLWGDEAKNFDGNDQPVLLVKGAKVGEFGGGKTLGTMGGSTIKLNPDLSEGHKLRGWFDNGGMAGDVKQLSSRTQGNFSTEWMNFHDAKLKNLGGGDKADYYQVCGFIHAVRSGNAFYKACPNKDCQKKVVDQENGTFRCDKCNVESPNFKYRLLVNMLVGDWTSNRWVTLFSDQAEALFGKTAHEIGTMVEHDKEEAEKLFTSVQFQQKIFKLRSKVETFQDVPRNKISIVNLSEVTYKDYNKHLLSNIQRLTGISHAPVF